MKQIIVLSILLGAASVAFAQTASFVAFAPDAQSISTGLTGVASVASANSNFNNTSATILSNKKMEVSALFAKWQPETADNSIIGAAGYYQLNSKMALDFGFRKFGYQSYDIYDDNGSMKGTFEPNEMEIGLGLGFKVSSQMAISADVNYIKSNLSDEGKATAYAIDLGLLYEIDSAFRFGAKIDNLGTKLKYDEVGYSLPMNLQAGLSYDYSINEKNMLTANVDLGYVVSFSQLTAGIGIEYSYNQMIKPRLGYHYGKDTKGIPSFASAGLEIEYFNVSLNFAYIIAGSDSPLKNSMSFGVGYGF